MREILFRGKRIYCCEWVEGYLFKDLFDNYVIRVFEICNGDSYIDDYIVIPATVGQFTGLYDKNGKKIFEGDIVAQNWYDHDEPSNDSFGKVVFCEYDCSFSVLDVEVHEIVPLGRCNAFHWEAEVIGNIHDNPELLKGETE